MKTRKISKVLSKDLVSGKSKYVKKDVMIFDKVEIAMRLQPIVRFYYKGKFLAELESKGSWFDGDTFVFSLMEGKMSIRVSEC